MWPVLRLVFLGLCLMVQAACSGAPAELVLTEQDHGSTVNAVPGQYLSVQLPGNPTTGFGWELRPAPDPQVLILVSEEYTPADKAGEKVGGGGTFRFRFRAAGAGTATLQLVYRRSWEEVPPEREFTVTVQVAPAQ